MIVLAIIMIVALLAGMILGLRYLP